MSIDKSPDKIVKISADTPTIEIQPHPKEILDLDEEAVAIARMKLAGLELDDFYGDEDRSSPGLMVRLQRQKIRDLFGSSEELKAAFSTPENTKQAYKDIQIDGIDLSFVKFYCAKKQIKFNSDAEALIAVGFDQGLSGDLNV
jgi:hypothetical protein